VTLSLSQYPLGYSNITGLDSGRVAVICNSSHGASSSDVGALSHSLSGVDRLMRLGLVIASFIAFAAMRRLFLLLPGGGGLGAVLHGSSGGCSHEDVGVSFLQLGQHFLAVFRLRKTA
jgi:hypothetical protein